MKSVAEKVCQGEESIACSKRNQYSGQSILHTGRMDFGY